MKIHLAINNKCAGEESPRGGFTLIDLIITVMIIGIIAAVGAPRFGALASRYRADAAARMIVNELNAARRQAMAASTTTEVKFDTSANTYRITGMKHRDHAAATNLVVLDQTGFPASLVSVDFDTRDTIRFDHFGRPTAVNGTEQSALISGTIVLQSGAESRSIVIDPTTGEASIP